MAISTYAELKSSIADFLNRDDLTASIDTFIDLAESNLNRDVRHWRMQIRSTLAISSQYTTLPSDWLEAGRISLQAAGTSEVKLTSSAAIGILRATNNNAVGVPANYAINGNSLEVQPNPDTTYTADILYTGRTPGLSADNPTNWLLTYAPDVYLYGTLIHTAPYLKDDARTTVWAALYNAALNNLNKDSTKAISGGSGLAIKVNSY
jgi:hypothetical protein